MNVNIVLFEGFETLDVFGPAEILGKIEEYDLHFYSLNGGITTSAQKVPTLTEKLNSSDLKGILLIPGGIGVKDLFSDKVFLDTLKEISAQADFCLSVCTGSILLARAGVINNRRATSNKRLFDWAKSSSLEVHWVEKARWVVDGKFYTSSGVSAGMDMTLGFIKDCLGEEKALEIAKQIEYIWNEDCYNDPCARM
jgi:putative intracellular protease/amidase